MLISDGINTYKIVKQMIKDELMELALSKDVILRFEFINSIFKTDNELIYKSDNPFEIKIDLIAKANNQVFISKVYKISACEGLTKEETETEAKKAKDLGYTPLEK